MDLLGPCQHPIPCSNFITEYRSSAGPAHLPQVLQDDNAKIIDNGINDAGYISRKRLKKERQKKNDKTGREKTENEGNKKADNKERKNERLNERRKTERKERKNKEMNDRKKER